MRIFYLFIFIVVTGCFSVGSQSKEKTMQPPNIIFILSDDHATNAISNYKYRFGKIAATPNIDRIANEGPIFYNVFSTNAI